MKLNLKQGLTGIFKINESESYDDDVNTYEEDYETEYDAEESEEEEYIEEEEPVKPSKKAFFAFGRKPKEEEPDDDIEEETDNTIIPFHGREEEGETVRVIKPQEFNEAQIVAEFLKEGKTIVVNLEGIEISQAQRIIDFIGGASYAVDGSLKAISNNIFIVAPGNIEVSGDLRDEIVGDSIISPELGKF